MSLDWLSAPCIQPATELADAARAHQLQLTKPPGSLGQLEAMAIQLASLQRTAQPAVDRVWISVFAADHGVAEEGVSAFPQVVTGEMVRNFATGGAAISVLARNLDAKLEVVNLGTVNDPGEIPGVRRAIIAPSTANFCVGPAMTEAQLDAALDAGAQSVRAASKASVQLFIGGDMGIANTTSAAALASALLDEPPSSLAGAGTGLNAAGIKHKVSVIERALVLHSTAKSAVEQLRCLGGFEIAALVGAYVAAAQAGIPVLVDGFISTTAAIAAVAIQPEARPWLLFAHRSKEHGHARLLMALQAEPLIDLGLRLGEASGAAIALPLLRLACTLHNGMATFEQAGVSNVD
ncbi:nicotinate-nucleotide--dimethylbenzimidazole phosphoribosyltransferase [Dyella flagellata]|uniref:Nicotinate-nucleotide--dimethylbenzimidazole phosphoribosyltransferase n=1 Tax=Dyella flagellata TaxID=1867833 RepID=A0ABQ5XB41_9GAMM|nr:nicotinate-nucleotide--dimethylbenzimidazole phosphoribosyltransferase [Dyella flagellata]GLQ88497.1 nicotinate-nucleotide--dimethylbenzimidazole phosphoribosyltransferase [Dyella flagellata]